MKPNWPLILALAFCTLFWVLVCAAWAGATSSIPRPAQQHRALLIREARAVWGMDAPTATFAAQIHQESAWRDDAVSPAGAQGLAQFMPSTAKWLPKVAPDTGQPLPFSPSWSIRAMVTFDRWLWQRIRAASDCDRMAMTLSAYNGGLGWLQKDQALAESVALNPRLWTHVALVNSGRSAANFRENRTYPTRILHKLTDLYRAAGWGLGACDGN